MSDIEFKVGKHVLRGKLFKPSNLPETKNPAVLFIHGWQSQQDGSFALADILSKKGYICLTFDLRGHGKSDGECKTSSCGDFLDDVVSAYDFLIDVNNVDRDRVTVIGSSLGSYLGSILSSKRKLHSLVLRVPANFKDKDFNTPLYELMNSKDFIRESNSLNEETMALKSISNFNGTILIVESEKDELVSHHMVQTYIDSVSNKHQLTYVIMPGAKHSISHDETLREAYIKIVTDFII